MTTLTRILVIFIFYQIHIFNAIVNARKQKPPTAFPSKSAIAPTSIDVSPPTKSDSKKRPNILFVLIDDIGKEYIQSYNSNINSQPGISQLAEEGVLFHHFYAMPQCSPSRVTLMTGQYPFHHGYSDHWGASERGHTRFLPDGATNSLGNVLKQAGYTTAIFGKWQVNDFRRELNVMHKKHGFDTYAVWVGQETSFNSAGGEVNSGKPDLRYTNPILVYKSLKSTNAKRDNLENINVKDGELGYSPDATIRNYTPYFLRDAIKKFIDDQLSNKNPWFIYYAMLLPHGESQAGGKGEFFYAPDTSKIGAATKFSHLSMVRDLDGEIKALVDHIDSKGLSENTLIIVTGDNGAPQNLEWDMRYAGEDNTVKGGKTMLTENGINMPFIARWKGTITPRIDSQTIFSLADILPTLADIAGAKLPSNKVVDGKSIVDVLLKNKSWIELYPNKDSLEFCISAIGTAEYTKNCPRYVVLQGGGDDAFVDGDNCARQSTPFRNRVILSLINWRGEYIKVRAQLKEDKTWVASFGTVILQVGVYGGASHGAQFNPLFDSLRIKNLFDAIKNSFPEQDTNFRNQFEIDELSSLYDEKIRSNAKSFDGCNRTSIDY